MHSDVAPNDVTVVIPVFNRLKELALTLPSYLSQRCVKEVIVVNDGSSANLTYLVDKLRERYRDLRMINVVKHLGSMGARNLGIAEATSEYVLLGEDDVYLEAGYTQCLREEMITHGFDAISGKLFRVDLYEDEKIEAVDRTQLARTQLGFPNDHKPLAVALEIFSHAATVDVPYTHIIALVRRQKLMAVHSDPWYSRGNGYREDTDLLLGLRSHGCRLGFTQKVECYHVRGDYSKTGGNRVGWVQGELWAAINTYYMLRKHWDVLSRDFALSHGPLRTTIRYMERRLTWHLMRAGARRTGAMA